MAFLQCMMQDERAYYKLDIESRPESTAALLLLLQAVIIKPKRSVVIHITVVIN